MMEDPGARGVLGAGELQQRLRAPDLEGAGGRGAGGAPGRVRHAARGQGGEGGERLLRGRPGPLAQHRLQLQLALLAGVCSRVGHSPHPAPPSSATKKQLRIENVSCLHVCE